MLILIAKILSNKYKDTFTARLGAALLLSQLGIVGTTAKIVVPFISGFIGLLIESGIYRIDLALDSIKEGRKLEEFKNIATEIYEKTISKIHTEQEKRKIEQQYLDLISLIGSVGP